MVRIDLERKEMDKVYINKEMKRQLDIKKGRGVMCF